MIELGLELGLGENETVERCRGRLWCNVEEGFGVVVLVGLEVIGVRRQRCEDLAQ